MISFAPDADAPVVVLSGREELLEVVACGQEDFPLVHQKTHPRRTRCSELLKSMNRSSSSAPRLVPSAAMRVQPPALWPTPRQYPLHAAVPAAQPLSPTGCTGPASIEPSRSVEDADCEDGDLCSLDFCSAGECFSEPKDCSLDSVCGISGIENACLVGFCDPATGACSTTETNCDDGDICTVDLCEATLGRFSAPRTDLPQERETSCSDGLDNDCDGSVDQADPDCALN